MDYLKAIDRVKKLLRLAENAGSQEEASIAATRAAEIMAEFQLSQAELKLASGDDKSREVIVKETIPTGVKKNRIAWKSTIVDAVAGSYGCKMFWWGPDVRVMGRESNVQATNYTSQYLFAEVERLCEEAWERAEPESRAEHVHHPVHGWVVVEKKVSARAWKNAFRNGAADVISVRLHEEQDARRESARSAARQATAHKTGEKYAAPRADALALVERDQAEVDQEYAEYSKGWKSASPLGSTSSSGGYSRGKVAGEKISIGGKRAGLGAGQGRLK